MTSLTRTASGYFRIEDSHSIEEVAAAAEADKASEDSGMTGTETAKLFIPADITLTKLGIIKLNDNRVTAFLNGNSSWPGNYRTEQTSDFKNIYRVYAGGRFLGTATIENGSLVPQKVMG
jgi:tRNA U55 pseudouridine synthase TruB